MKELFLILAPYSTILFLISFPPEIIRNFKTKVYASGTLVSWSIRLTVYLIFGIYSWVIGQYIVAFVQLVAFGFTAVIIIQNFVYRHAK